jgi:hypothetical protein
VKASEAIDWLMDHNYNVSLVLATCRMLGDAQRRDRWLILHEFVKEKKFIEEELPS